MPIILLYLAVSFAKIFETEGVILEFSSYLYALNLWNSREFLGGIPAYLIAGIIYLIIFELIARIYFVVIRPFFRAFRSDDAMYYLRFFAIMAYVVCGALKMLYHALPLMFVFGEAMIEFVVFSGFYLWYFFYIKGRCFAPVGSGLSLVIMSVPYLGYYLISTFISILGGLF